MQDTAPDGGEACSDTMEMPVAESTPWNHLVLRRRRFLVNRRYQVRVTAVTVGTVFVLLLALNFTLYAFNHGSTRAAIGVAPELKHYFAAQDRFQIGLTLLGSLAFLAGVFVLGILETHRTAGASFNLCRCLDQLRDGRYGIRVRLRRGDNLKEVEMAFNEMAEALQERTRRDAAVLDELAARLDRIREAGASPVAEEMRKLAAEQRRLAG